MVNDILDVVSITNDNAHLHFLGKVVQEVCLYDRFLKVLSQVDNGDVLADISSMEVQDINDEAAKDYNVVDHVVYILQVLYFLIMNNNIDIVSK